HTNAVPWWSLKNFGYFEKIGLFSGSSISPSIAINPSLRAFVNRSKSIFSDSTYSFCVTPLPFITDINPTPTAFSTRIGFPTISVPTAAPTIVTNSDGCSSTGSFPLSIRNPPTTDPRTMTIPTSEIMELLNLEHRDASSLYRHQAQLH